VPEPKVSRRFSRAGWITETSASEERTGLSSVASLFRPGDTFPRNRQHHVLRDLRSRSAVFDRARQPRNEQAPRVAIITPKTV